MKKLPISTQTFSEIIRNDMIYVDKTEYVYQLVNSSRYCFLSRPRRFGKSLLLSTLESYFRGERELFKGLYIAEHEKQWTIYPVIRIDYSFITYQFGIEKFIDSFANYIREIGEKYEIQLSSRLPTDILVELVFELRKKYDQQVVVLVDEYDKPMVDVFSQPEIYAENRRFLNQFYGVIKALDAHIRFTMLTGVTRFSRTSIFSGMNNVDDISQSWRYGSVVGFTQIEVEEYFSEYLQQIESHFSKNRHEILQEIRDWYNGFSFEGKVYVYNPFSLLKLFLERRFKDYWFATGTPTFLLEQIKKKGYLPEIFEQKYYFDLMGNSIGLSDLPMIPLLFQTGYLTIKEVLLNGYEEYYRLGYPNREVKRSFLNHLSAAFLQRNNNEVESEVTALRKNFVAENWQLFIKKYEAYLADIPKRLHIPREAYYHSLTYMLFRMIGFKLILEKETDKGRIDAVLELDEKVYVLEFKFAPDKRTKNTTTLAKKAIQQIKDNGYAEPYLDGKRRVLLVGMGFVNRKIAIQTEEL